MWFKILEFIWKTSPKEGERAAEREEATEEGRVQVQDHPIRPSLQREKPEDAECLESNSEQPAAGPRRPHRLANAIREYGEIAVFGAAVLAILVVGERNMWSSQLRYQQEPIVCLGTGPVQFASISHLQGNIGQWSPIAGTILAILGSAYLLLAEGMEEEKQNPGGTGIVRIIARSFMKLGQGFETIARKIFDDSEFRRGQATGYPEVPGEEHRNPGLSDTRSIYSPSLRRDSSGSDHSALTRQRSGVAESSNTRTIAKRRDTLEVPASPGQHGSLQGAGELNRCVSEEGQYGALQGAGDLSRCVSETAPTTLTRTPTIVVSPSPVYVPERQPKSRRHTTESAIR